MNKLIKFANWLATLRTAIVCVVFAGLVWCQDELAWQAGHKAARQEGGVAEYSALPAAVADKRANRTARLWLGLMNYHANRMENQ